MKQCLSIVLAVILTAAFAATAQPRPTDSHQPRQVILIIGDGMDEQQIAIARNYLKGATGRLVMDGLPLRATAQVLTIEDKVGGKPMYVADSANTATSMATGEITSRGRIATAAGSDEDLTTIVQLAVAAGLNLSLIHISEPTRLC